MTKRIHPAESSRKLIGVASGVALVGIVTGFQFSANAQEADQAKEVTPQTVTSSPTANQENAVSPEAAPEAVPAAPVQQAAPAGEAPAGEAPAPAPVEAPAVVAPAAPAAPAAPVAPAAPAAPVNGTTAGSGG